MIPFLVTRTDRAIIKELSSHEQRIQEMALDISKLTAEVASISNAVAATAALVHKIADEVKALRTEGGGAVQNQVDALAAQLHGAADALGVAVAEGTAAEGDFPPPAPTSEQVLQGAAQAAADHLNSQAENPPA